MRFLIASVFFLLSTVLHAHDFSSCCTPGQTLYYNVIDSVGYKVSVTYPGPSIDSAYYNYDQPSGELVIPSSVNYNGQQYLVTEIESCAFAKCTGLNGKLELPHTITSIGSYAFMHCGNIQVLYFNCEHCTSAFAAFEGCAFDTIYLGDSVTVIPDGVFSNSDGITTIQIPPLVQTIGSRAFYNCPNLSRIDFSDSVVTIGDFAFSDCPMLETVNQINADTMGEYAFWGCRGLHSLSIGSDVKEIGNFAYFLADSIDTVYCWAPNPPLLGEHSFSDGLFAGCLVVSCFALELYQAATGWSDFQNIVADTSFVLEVTAIPSDYGFVTGSGNGFCQGEICRIEAMPYQGFVFQNWSDGMTDNPRDVVIQSDTLFVAQFTVDSTLTIEETECCGDLVVVAMGKSIKMTSTCPELFYVYDIVGKCYYISTSKEVDACCIVPQNGVYVVVLGNGLVKKIIVM